MIADIVLILVSGSACLYCGLLSRQLKALQNLKTGIGASIVSLTDAIYETNASAKEAQTNALETVETLRQLLEKSHIETPKIEALLISLRNAASSAEDQCELLNNKLEDNLASTICSAKQTATELLETIRIVDDYRKHTLEAITQTTVTSTPEPHNLPIDQTQSHIKAVS